MKKSYEPIPKAPKPERNPRKGMARPDEPLATWCRLRINPGVVCTGRAEVRHHRLLRSQGGSDAATNTIDICDACHRHVHANRRLAYARKWILRPERKTA